MSVQKIRKAIEKIIDLKINCVEFEGKIVTREDLYELLEKEEQKQKFIKIANYEDAIDRHTSYVKKVDNRTYQIMFDFETELNPIVKTWMFKITLN